MGSLPEDWKNIRGEFRSSTYLEALIEGEGHLQLTTLADLWLKKLAETGLREADPSSGSIPKELSSWYPNAGALRSNLFTNNRPEEVTLDPELHIILRDAQGREFGTDPDAWEFVPTRLNLFLQPVNPGISQDGRIIYEVPPDAEGFVLILDDVEFWEDKTARYDLGALPTRAYVR